MKKDKIKFRGHKPYFYSDLERIHQAKKTKIETEPFNDFFDYVKKAADDIEPHEIKNPSPNEYTRGNKQVKN